MKAIWNDQVIAESDETIVIEGNHYFPPAHVHKLFMVEALPTRFVRGRARPLTTIWKLMASASKTMLGIILSAGHWPSR